MKPIVIAVNSPPARVAGPACSSAADGHQASDRWRGKSRRTVRSQCWQHREIDDRRTESRSRMAPTVKRWRRHRSRQHRGASRRATIAAKAMAEAPPGQPVTIQNSATAPIAANVRAGTRPEAGSQSGTRSRNCCAPGEWCCRIADEQCQPVERMPMPANASAVLSASSRSEGVSAGRDDQSSAPPARKPVQGHGISDPAHRSSPLPVADRKLRREAFAGWSAPLAAPRCRANGPRWSATPRQAGQRGEQAVHRSLQHSASDSGAAEIPRAPDR